MTVSIYLDDKLNERLNRAASEIGLTRSAIIRKAVEEWLARRQPERWPEAVLAFKGVCGAPRFEKARKSP